MDFLNHLSFITDNPLPPDVSVTDTNIGRAVAHSQCDNSSERVAIGFVDQDYMAFISHHPDGYNSDALAALAAQYCIAGDGDLLKRLRHEVLLASLGHHLAELMTTELRALSQGYRPVDELQPIDGRSIKFFDDTRVFTLHMNEADRWELASQDNSNSVLEFDGLLGVHDAYQQAVKDGFIGANTAQAGLILYMVIH